MTAYAADNAAASAGTVTTKRTGTTSSDTVPAGSIVLWINGGAGTHVVTLTNSATQDGLAVAARTISILTATAKVGRVPSTMGDANGQVAVGIDGTAAEITYYVLGGVG